MTLPAALAARRSTCVLDREKRLWQDLLANPCDWWDYRLDKKSIRLPDFRHRTIRETLWMSSQFKPPCVDGLLPPPGAMTQTDCHSHVLPLQGHADLDKLLHVVLCMEVRPSSPGLFWSLARGCSSERSLGHSKQFFDHLVNFTLEAFSLVAEYIVGIFAKCGDSKTALGAFCMLPYRGAFSWTALIFMYVDREEPKVALELYQLMQEENVNPTERTFVALLRACGCTLDLEKGREVHNAAQRAGMATNAFVICTVVSMYGKCGSLKEAVGAFCSMPNHCIVSWTALLTAFVEHGEEAESLQLYKVMLEKGVIPNDRTFVVALDACGAFCIRDCPFSERLRCAKSASLEIGRFLHADARKRLYHTDKFVRSALVSLYGKCGRILEAENVFSSGKGFDEQNIVPWNAMLSAYLECGLEKAALQLYAWLLKRSFALNKRTYVIVIQASCMLATKEDAIMMDQKPAKFRSLEVVRAIHEEVQSKSYAEDVHVGSTLVSAYGKCGNVLEAENVFSKLQIVDLVAWTGLLFMYVEIGDMNKALYVYMQMQERGMTLDDAVFVCALQACADLGNIMICKQIHFALSCSSCSLSAALALNIIYTYGYCTHMENAKAVFEGLHSPNVASWTALGDGYAREGNYVKSLVLFEESKETSIDPDGVSFLVALAACGHIGLVDRGIQYFESMCKDYSVLPEVKHYVCMANLLGRAGDVLKLEAFLSRMDTQPNMTFWLCLLDACRVYGNVRVAKLAFNQVMQLDQRESSAYALTWDPHINAGLWEAVGWG